MATGGALLLLIMFWTGAGFGLADLEVTIACLPLWIWVSIGGSWLLALILVHLLTTGVFAEMDLEDEEGNHDGR